jgi:ribosomal protein S18 acetylase RimI-like enzyme
MPSSMPSPPVVIEAVGRAPRRFEQALAVLRRGLGQDFISTDRFMLYAAPRAPKPYRAALAAMDGVTGDVIGALTVEIASARTIRESFLDSYELARGHADIRRLRPGRTGLIKSIAVAPMSRGRGVATALIQRGLRGLAEHGARAYYSLAWESERDGCLLYGPLTVAGFQSALRLERFWYQDSLAHGYVCPACGFPCVCAAQVMIRWGRPDEADEA